MTAVKRCTLCEKVKVITEFQPRPDRPGQHRTRCSSCQSKVPLVPNEKVRPHVDALVSHYGGVMPAARAYADRHQVHFEAAHRRFIAIRSGSSVHEETYDRILTLHRSLTRQRIISLSVIPVGQAEWQEEALCAQLTPETFDSMFYAEGAGNGEAKRARAICAQCPVWEECIRYAAKETHSWQYGVVGGLSQHERRKMDVGQAVEVARARRQEAVA